MRPGRGCFVLDCCRGTAHSLKCDNDCLCCMWKLISYESPKLETDPTSSGMALKKLRDALSSDQPAQDQPFKDEDVVGTWITEGDDVQIKKCLAVDANGFRELYWQPVPGGSWYRVVPGLCDIAELLRQLVAVQKIQEEKP